MATYIEMKQLEGEHELIYVERGHMKTKDEHFYWDDEAEYLLFVLDGVSYKAVENPGDGYRSNLAYIVVDDEVPIQATLSSFPPQKVYAKMLTPEDELAQNNDRWEYSFEHKENDILIIYDAETRLPVIEIGTTNTDDYYPCWMCRYNPEHMAINLPARSQS